MSGATGVREPAWIRGHGVAREGASDLEDLFAGRWDPKRAIQGEQRALVQAAVDAALAAGWWAPGRTIDAGLLVAVDLYGWDQAERFGRSLLPQPGGRAATLRPSTFLFSLPSTPASTLGLLFGCERYQCTIDTLGSGGARAAQHALDLLRRGRLERVLLAALTAVAPEVAARLPAPLAGEGRFTLGVALCLQRDPRGALGALAAASVGQVDPGGGEETEAHLGDVPPGYRVLAAPTLLAAIRALEQGGQRRVVQRDPCFGDVGVLDVARPGPTV